jgi:hypothetical protein
MTSENVAQALETPRDRASEDVFSAEVVSFFSSMLNASDFRGVVEVLEKQQVLMNLTVGRDDRSRAWRYYLGMQQQDIVFYLADESNSIELLGAPLQFHWASRSQVSQGRVRIPLLICELKINRNLTTAAFITYSKIAEQIRDVHPYCAYYFIVGGSPRRKVMPETVLRQAKTFSRVFLDWEREKTNVWRDVENHLVYVRDRLKLFDGPKNDQ